jgi:hypothetical protein
MGFAHLEATDTTKEKDSVGGGSFLLDSGIYGAKIDMAYQGESKGGAASVTVHLITTEGKEVRETIYISSGKAKGCKTYYEKDGEKKPLPGFTLADNMAQLTTGQGILALTTSKKLIKKYDPVQKKEVPTEVEVFDELLGKEVYVAVVKELQDKNVKDATGNYVPSGETREVNAIDKFFRAADKMTYAETLNSDLEEAEFFSVWDGKNTGKVRDKSTKSGGTAGVPAAVAAKAAAAPVPSLFN